MFSRRNSCSQLYARVERAKVLQSDPAHHRSLRRGTRRLNPSTRFLLDPPVVLKACLLRDPVNYLIYFQQNCFNFNNCSTVVTCYKYF